MVTNSVKPHLTVSKRHNPLSYHRVCEAIAAGMVNFYWTDGKSNPANIVSKHWTYPQVWHMLQPILFYSGDTIHLLKDIDPDSKMLSKEEKKRDEYGLVTNESIRVKVRDGDGSGQNTLPLTCSETHQPVQLPEPLLTAAQPINLLPIFR
jgi:hypothetical protein